MSGEVYYPGQQPVPVYNREYDQPRPRSGYSNAVPDPTQEDYFDGAPPYAEQDVNPPHSRRGRK
jgi:hypothetical protein